MYSYPKGLPHRMEVVAEQEDVVWYNDSKATNPGATAAALSGMTRKAVLIAGGEAKGADFDDLKPLVAEHTQAVILLGKDAEKLEASWKGTVPLFEGAATSQFRNHMLAISGRAVANTQPNYAAVAMLNVIGDEGPAEAAEAIHNAHRHSYGKEARPARKLGHVTLVADNEADRDSTITELSGLLPDAVWPPQNKGL